jgi:hypothetical protein
MIDFTNVTELADDEVSREQVDRLAQRYYWAAGYVDDKEVLEVACGVGQGLGYLASRARRLIAGDITPSLVERARQHYGSRIEIGVMDALALPVPSASLDVVLLFEAIYYLPDAARFVAECRRVLRPGGRVLVVTANKDLFDFNPSPHSHRYYGVSDLGQLFGASGFSCQFFGGTRVDGVSWRQRLLRPVKAAAVRFNLIPKTMGGKKLLKSLVFGKLVKMPAEINGETSVYRAPESISAGTPDLGHKVLFLAATLGSGA